MFSSPVRQAIIRPHGTPTILGDFHVTATFGQIDSFHPPPGHGGVDIGDGKCGDQLLAMATGKITMAQYLDSPLGPKTALTVRGVGDAHPDYEWAIAHCASLSVKVGDRVTAGQVVAVLGKTGTTACHAHLGCKRKINGVWVSVDIWPLLDQNSAPEDELDPSFAPKPNRTVTVNKGARHRTAPTAATTANIAIGSDPGGPLGFPLMGTVVGVPPSTDPGNAIWYAYWRTEVSKVYYLHTSACGPETPWESVGHTDAELAQAAKAAAQDVAVAASNTATKYP
jgi:hypothetical protein